MQNNRKVGAFYEERVAHWLEERGYRILARNFRCQFGEIDLIAQKDETIVFVEVKYRKSGSCGVPEEAVGCHKQVRISNVASFYLYCHSYPPETPCRFDVASVAGEQVHLIKNAFPYCGEFG